MKQCTKPIKSEHGSEISRQQIVEDLRRLGVKSGDHIALGISLSRVGKVAGGANTFIDALLESVGADGTVMVNAFTRHFGLTKLKAGIVDYTFDARSTPCNTGIVPEILRTYPQAVRSKHPVTSVAAVGRLASFLTEGHGPGSPAYLPFSRLAEIEGKYLSIGINNRLVGFRHEAQYRAGLLHVVPKKLGVKYRDDCGEIRMFVNTEPPGCVSTLGRLGGYLDAAGLPSKGRVGRAPSMLIPAKESLEIMAAVLKEEPEINLCDDVLCLWCRELERRLDLYPRLENPRFFQRSRIVISVLRLGNRLRMGDNRLLAGMWKAFALFRRTS